MPWSMASTMLAAGYPGRRYLPHLPEQPEEVVVADVEAHITGTVWKIEVQIGDDVEEGDTLVVLE